MSAVTLSARRGFVLAIVAAVTLATWSSRALAQAEAEPGFMTLDRMDATRRVGLQLGFLKFTSVPLDGASLLRLEIYAQALLPGKSLGLYGQIPSSVLVAPDAEDRGAHGNLEVGAFYLLGGAANVILRGGFSIGIASDDVDSLLNADTTLERITDIVGIVRDTTALRLSASTRRQLTTLFYRADVGFDLFIASPADDDAILRANIAVGARLSAVDLTAELANITALGGHTSFTESSLHTLGFGLRTRGATRFHLGLVFPLDQEIRGELWIVSLGLHGAP